MRPSSPNSSGAPEEQTDLFPIDPAPALPGTSAPLPAEVQLDLESAGGTPRRPALRARPADIDALVSPSSGTGVSSEETVDEVVAFAPPVAPPPRPAEGVPPPVELPLEPGPGVQPPAGEDLVLPARMLNEFVYCPRLFYYEFVEGVFVASEDTERGAAIHARVDRGSGALPGGGRAEKIGDGGSKIAGGDSADDGASSVTGHSSSVIDAQPPTVAAGSPPSTLNSQPSTSTAPSETAPKKRRRRGGQGDSADVAGETIHCRSVSLGSERLGVVAKLDLVELELHAPASAVGEPAIAAVDPADASGGAGEDGATRQGAEGAGWSVEGGSAQAILGGPVDATIQPMPMAGPPAPDQPARPGGNAPLDSQFAIHGCPVTPGRLAPLGSPPPRVCPVDYKAGAPRAGAEGWELWPADRMQLGVQCLLLRDNGYRCDEGIIYYRATRQRVRLEVTPALEAWIVEQIARARATARGPIPPPLIGSPKCARCSLAPVCLPDETRLLQGPAVAEWEAEARHRADGAHVPGAAVGVPSDHGATAHFSPLTSHSSPRPLRPSVVPRSDARALYLNSPGLRVGRVDELLQVREKDALREQVRLSDLDHVAVFGPIQVTTQAVQALCEHDIPVSWFSTGGWFYGMTRGHSLKNVFLRIRQFEVARDPTACLALAREFVHGKVRNQRVLLMRNFLDAPREALLRLRRAADDVHRAGSLESLLGVEGAAAHEYFAQFGGMLKAGGGPDSGGANDLEDDDLPGLEPANDAERSQRDAVRSTGLREAFTFDFHGRNRRPPTDPVNALLSLGYSLLAKECLLAAQAVGFDPYVGFFHQPRFGRPALALDVMEEFRPLVAESAALTAINNRLVTPGDFIRAGRAVNLTKEGRRAFFLCFEKRLGSLVTHPVFDYKVSYRRAIELQFRILARALTGEIPRYVPFLTR